MLLFYTLNNNFVENYEFLFLFNVDSSKNKIIILKRIKVNNSLNSYNIQCSVPWRCAGKNKSKYYERCGIASVDTGPISLLYNINFVLVIIVC